MRKLTDCRLELNLFPSDYWKRFHTTILIHDSLTMSHKLWLIIRLNPGILKIFELCEWIAQIIELQKSLRMIPKANQFPGSWISKIDFKTFAWAFGRVDIPGQIVQKMRYKIPHQLMSMSSWGIMQQIWFWMKNRLKMEITWVKIAWVKTAWV